MQIALIGQEYGDTGFSGWHLVQGTGFRSFDKFVAFQNPLLTTPIVQVNLCEVDSDAQHNLRVEVLALNVTNVGFTLRMQTWSDTKLYAVRANWFAVTP
jgi:hypothetical protein